MGKAHLLEHSPCGSRNRGAFQRATPVFLQQRPTILTFSRETFRFCLPKPCLRHKAAGLPLPKEADTSLKHLIGNDEKEFDYDN